MKLTFKNKKLIISVIEDDELVRRPITGLISGVITGWKKETIIGVITMVLQDDSSTDLVSVRSS